MKLLLANIDGKRSGSVGVGVGVVGGKDGRLGSRRTGVA